VEVAWLAVEFLLQRLDFPAFRRCSLVKSIRAAALVTQPVTKQDSGL
jgi:hypothetical protein